MLVIERPHVWLSSRSHKQRTANLVFVIGSRRSWAVTPCLATPCALSEANVRQNSVFAPGAESRVGDSDQNEFRLMWEMYEYFLSEMNLSSVPLKPRKLYEKLTPPYP